MQRGFVVEAYEGFEGPDLADNNVAEECEEDSAEKYRKLLNLVAEEEQKKKDEEPDVDMEITWELGSKVEILNCVVYLQKEGGRHCFNVVVFLLGRDLKASGEKRRREADTLGEMFEEEKGEAEEKEFGEARVEEQ